MNEVRYADSFPVTLYMRPGLKFSVKLGRKLFGLQRYGITATGSNHVYRCDYATREEAQIIADTATLLSRLWSIFESNPGVIKNMVTYLSGEEVDPGYGDRSVFGLLIHGYDPGLIASMLEDYPPGFLDLTREPVKVNPNPVKPTATLNQFF